MRCFESDEEVNMILDSANFLRPGAQATNCAAEILVKTRAATVFDGWHTVLSRKD